MDSDKIQGEDPQYPERTALSVSGLLADGTGRRPILRADPSHGSFMSWKRLRKPQQGNHESAMDGLGRSLWERHAGDTGYPLIPGYSEEKFSGAPYFFFTVDVGKDGGLLYHPQPGDTVLAGLMPSKRGTTW